MKLPARRARFLLWGTQPGQQGLPEVCHYDFSRLYPFEDQYHFGINLGHDRAAAITSGGSLLIAIEQERLDRQKHSPGIQRANGKVQLDLPWNAIHYCLDAVGIDLHELASVTANSPGHDFGPQLAARCFGRVPVRQLPSHHLGHAYSAWWPSGLKDSIVLVVDAHRQHGRK
jgi:carbamoyltransferase